MKKLLVKRILSRLRRPGFLLMLWVLSGNLSAQSGFTKLNDWMESNTKEMGGRAILVIYKDGKMIYDKSVGDMSFRQKSLNKKVAKKLGVEADLEDYTLDSRQLVASCSKWYSAALIMTFVDEGKLRLSDTVGTFLPVLSAHGKGNITISECLSMLTGVKAPPLKESLKGIKNLASMDQAIDEIAIMPMEGEHGKTFHYSSVGLQIAASVIEKISGQTFETLFESRIAMPLGMKNTDFGKHAFVLPAGGARSTPQDYLHFLSMILQKGSYNGKQILTTKSVDEMEINRIGPDVKISYTPEQAEGLGYGFGEWIFKNGEPGMPAKWVSCPGLFGSFPWVDNEHRYCAFLMTFYLNNKDRHKRYFELKQLVDQSVL